MQKRTNIQLLVSLTVMIILITALFFFNSLKNSPAVEKGIFQIENLEKVDRVVLQSATEKTVLKFDGVKWVVNEKNEADRQMIKVLFAALKQVEAKRKVATHIQDSLQKEISKNGIKVSCFEGESLAKEFWSGGNQQRSESYFQLNDGIPYVVTIPGYRVYVASVFEIPTNDWRDKRVFNFNWQNFKSLEANFPSDPKQNFKVSFRDKFFGIEGVDADTTKLNNFLDAVSLLRADRILTEEQAKAYDSLVSTQPVEVFTIHDIANRSYDLKIFAALKGKSTLVAKKDGEVIELNPMALREVAKKKDYFRSSQK